VIGTIGRPNNGGAIEHDKSLQTSPLLQKSGKDSGARKAITPCSARETCGTALQSPRLPAKLLLSVLPIAGS
jgi:hypothetical protein